MRKKASRATVGLGWLLLFGLWPWTVAVTVASETELPVDEPKKIAFLVGVSKYDRQGFRDLDFAEGDMQALAHRLKELGFETVAILGSAQPESSAGRDAILESFEQVFLPKLKGLKKSDVAVLAFAGHGRHASIARDGVLVEDHFFCPGDSHDADPETWISISQIVNQVEVFSGSERNLILVDACRDNPSRGRGADGRGFTLSRDAVAILFASSYGEQAWEHCEFQHGLFTYYVLDGLAGAAANFDQNVTWDSLVDYVKSRVEQKSTELEKAKTISNVQRPNSIGNLRGGSPILATKSQLTEAPALPVAGAPANRPMPQKIDYITEHDGAGAMLMKEPDFIAFLETSTGRLNEKSIGRLINGTKLADLQERHNDPVPWLKVKVLDGDFAGKEGWVQQRSVRKP
jgi:hypothetical protein